VAKILYIAKQVKPECLTAVSFLTSRVEAYDTDDLRKVGNDYWVLGVRVFHGQ
jgi:hypothetical protein